MKLLNMFFLALILAFGLSGTVFAYGGIDRTPSALTLPATVLPADVDVDVDRDDLDLDDDDDDWDVDVDRDWDDKYYDDWDVDIDKDD